MTDSEALSFLDSHPFVRSTAQDKVYGVIFGSALGDCIGLYTEFLPASAAEKAYPERKFTLQPPTPFRPDTHRDKFDQAAWTDDTDHSLLILLSYLHNNGEILPEDFAARLAIWVREGLRCLDRLPLGIGQTIGIIARKPDFPKAPFDVALDSWLKTGRSNAANGSLMRTHPLGIMCVGFNFEKTVSTAALMSRTTHVDPRCVLACCISTALIRGILRGEVVSEADVDEVLNNCYDWVLSQNDIHNPGLETGLPLEVQNNLLNAQEFRRHVHVHTFAELELDDSQKMGYVYKCLGSAILSLRLAMREKIPAPHTFENIITDLVMQGGDADTNATAAGALLGAWLGFSCLPSEWTDGIKHREWLLKKTENISRLVGISAHGREPEPKDDPDTELYGGKVPMTEQEVSKMEKDLLIKILEKNRDRREEEDKKKGEQRKRGFGGLVERFRKD
jgi:ADP-ribosylglycohydrolase